MRVLVVGAGAVGGYFGARLAAAGRDVAFLVRPARAATLTEHGLRINEPDGSGSRIRPTLVTADRLQPGWDLVLLSVKAYALDAALADLTPAVDGRTAILPALNGMRHMDVLRETFGSSAVLGGVAFISAHLDDAGVIEVGGVLPALTFGETDGRLSDRITGVDRTLRDAGFATRLSETIGLDMWEKWYLLAAAGAFNTLMRGPIGPAVAVPGGRETALAILAETGAVCTAAGSAPRSAAVERARAMMTDTDSPFTTSMYKDLVAGHPLEDEQIIGDLVDRAETAGVDVPLLRAARAALAVGGAGAGARPV
ncbi:2-dehydropantoate 2-reductase [Nakamurella sp. YIM 132087]|uniref:2-dehydropantoate 2-reductase n=1 Tax=Nakamurella alba TaxID=2665158 RepID=A0A7K1FPQ7_9ACTN|nr:ketopantoate reductase family protein [Nakamurella alba]MTD16060.1 2-dehydropantoate 2-reductase [Nakamurella alba]